MKRFLVILIISGIILSVAIIRCSAGKDPSDLLKEGLLGAGAGAVGGAVTGGEDIWKGALAGAGVNIIGGMILDSMTGERVDSVDHVKSMDSQGAFSEGYKDGYQNGYKQGYAEGYRAAVADTNKK